MATEQIPTDLIADDAVNTDQIANNASISTSGNITTTGSGTLTVAGASTLTGGIANAGTITAGTIGGGVAMASSGLTVRNITQVSLGSDQSLSNDATATTFFAPTYTPLFSGSKVQGILMVYGFVNRSGAADARKNFTLNFTGSGITDLSTYSSDDNIGGYDHGSSGHAASLQQLIGGQLLTTSSTAAITCNCILKNPETGSSEWVIYANGTVSETHFTWIEYK